MSARTARRRAEWRAVEPRQGSLTEWRDNLHDVGREHRIGRDGPLRRQRLLRRVGRFAASGRAGLGPVAVGDHGLAAGHVHDRLIRRQTGRVRQPGEIRRQERREDAGAERPHEFILTPGIQRVKLR